MGSLLGKKEWLEKRSFDQLWSTGQQNTVSRQSFYPTTTKSKRFRGMYREGHEEDSISTVSTDFQDFVEMFKQHTIRDTVYCVDSSPACSRAWPCGRGPWSGGRPGPRTRAPFRRRTPWRARCVRRPATTRVRLVEAGWSAWREAGWQELWESPFRGSAFRRW